MKHILTAVCVLSATAGMAHETTADVVDHYKTVKECTNNKAEGAITGALLGGLLIGTITETDRGAGIGALIGGLAGADGKKETCTTRQEYSHTTVTFIHNGVEKTFSFTDK